VYIHYEDEGKIGVYDDHAASAGLYELEYAYLCEECAEVRGAEVAYPFTMAAGQSAYCDPCGRPNRVEEEEEYEDEE
jgi:hypothetical protein